MNILTFSTPLSIQFFFDIGESMLLDIYIFDRIPRYKDETLPINFQSCGTHCHSDKLANNPADSKNVYHFKSGQD